MDKYKLLQYLKDNPEKINTVNLISQKLDLKPSNCRYFLQQLECMKLVDRYKQMIAYSDGIKRPTNVYFAIRTA